MKIKDTSIVTIQRKSKLEIIEFYILSNEQPRYNSWPFDKAILICKIQTQYVPKIHEMVRLNEPIDNNTDFRVSQIGYRVSKNKMIPCILLDK